MPDAQKRGGRKVVEHYAWHAVPTSLNHMTLVMAPGGRPKTHIPEATSRLNKCSVQHGATRDQGLAHGVV